MDGEGLDNSNASADALGRITFDNSFGINPYGRTYYPNITHGLFDVKFRHSSSTRIEAGLLDGHIESIGLLWQVPDNYMQWVYVR